MIARTLCTKFNPMKRTSFTDEFNRLALSKEMQEELDDMIENFRPVFGVAEHIRISQDIGKLNTLIIKQKKRHKIIVEKRIKLGKREMGQQKLEFWGLKIRKLKREIHWQLKTYGKINPKADSLQQN